MAYHNPVVGDAMAAEAPLPSHQSVAPTGTTYELVRVTPHPLTDAAGAGPPRLPIGHIATNPSADDDDDDEVAPLRHQGRARAAPLWARPLSPRVQIAQRAAYADDDATLAALAQELSGMTMPLPAHDAPSAEQAGRVTPVALDRRTAMSGASPRRPRTRTADDDTAVELIWESIYDYRMNVAPREFVRREVFEQLQQQSAWLTEQVLQLQQQIAARDAQLSEKIHSSSQTLQQQIGAIIDRIAHERYSDERAVHVRERSISDRTSVSIWQLVIGVLTMLGGAIIGHLVK